MQDKADNSLRVIIMCKAPVPGRVKTRLCPGYSAEEAAEIHQAMATTVIERASRLFAEVWIASDDIEHPFFNRFSLSKVSQSRGDLGDRMMHLLKQAFSDGAKSVLFLGTDSPHMPESRLLKVAELLAKFDAVVGPVEDGGYDLIAMNHPYIDLFKEIRWSSEGVLKETLQRAKALGVKVKLLDMGFDLDSAESLVRVLPMWRSPFHSPEKYPEN